MARTPVRSAEFTGSDGTNLESYTGGALGSTSWSQKSFGQGAGYVVIQGNELGTAFGDGSALVYREDAGTYSGDQYAKTTLKDFGGFAYDAGVAVRVGTGTGGSAQWYAVFVREEGASSHYSLHKCVAGTVGTPLIDLASQSYSDGDTIELEAITEGSDCHLIIYRNGVEINDYLDTSSPLTGGSAGLYFKTGSGNLIRMDNWEGGDATGSSGPAEDDLTGSALTSGSGTAVPNISIGL
jgi:hypothetical protein